MKEETKDIVIQKSHLPEAYIPNASEWKFMVEWGESAVKSGMLPSSIKTKEAAAIIALKGREMGVSFMTAVAHLNVIGGKPAMSAELMQAQAKKNLPGLQIVPVAVSKTHAEVKFKRPEKGSDWFHSSFTMEDAKEAQLLSNPSWKKYPKAMLWSRAVTAGLRIVCPEALIGASHTPEELGATVDEDGHVIETTSTPVSVDETTEETTEENEIKKEPKFHIISAEEKAKIVAAEAMEKSILIKEMIELKKELAISDDVAKKILLDDFECESAKSLNNEALKKFLAKLRMVSLSLSVNNGQPYDPNFDEGYVK